MLNPELFCNEYRAEDGTWRSARFQDDVDDGITIGPHTEVRYGDRRPYVIIPVPGESEWATQAFSTAAGGGSDIDASVVSPPPTRFPSKRLRPEQEADKEDTTSMSMMVTDATTANAAEEGEEDEVSAVDSCRQCIDHSHGEQQQQQQKPATPFVPGSCMIYVYSSSPSSDQDQDQDQETEGAIKLNDVVEVVGVLSHAPDLAAAHLHHASATQQGTDDVAMSMLDEEMLAAHPPTSQVPRIHALSLMPSSSPVPAQQSSSLVSKDTIASVRARTIGFLSMVMGGDDVAAEFLLLQMIASVQRRNKDGVVGVYPLNITNCPPPTTTTTTTEQKERMSEFGEAVATAASLLHPRTLSLPLSLSFLNDASSPWIPRRGAEEVCMHYGVLQMAPHTFVVADEGVMEGGQLNEVGLRKLGALQGVMQGQKIGYDFQFFTMEQPTDAPVTVLSAARTMLKGVGEVVVPLAPKAPTAAGAAAVLAAVQGGGADLGPAREYVQLARKRNEGFTIPEALGGALEQELASAKQKDESVTPETFHVWLNLARLLVASYGEEELTQERWHQALALDAERQKRLTA